MRRARRAPRNRYRVQQRRQLEVAAAGAPRRAGPGEGGEGETRAGARAATAPRRRRGRRLAQQRAAARRRAAATPTTVPQTIPTLPRVAPATPAADLAAIQRTFDRLNAVVPDRRRVGHRRLERGQLLGGGGRLLGRAVHDLRSRSGRRCRVGGIRRAPGHAVARPRLGRPRRRQGADRPDLLDRGRQHPNARDDRPEAAAERGDARNRQHGGHGVPLLSLRVVRLLHCGSTGAGGTDGTGGGDGMPRRRAEETAAELLATWTDSDTAMQIVGTSLGLFGANRLDPEIVLAKETPLRNALFDVLLSLVEGGALDVRPAGDGHYAFRWRADYAVGALTPEMASTVDIEAPSPYLAELAEARRERDAAVARAADAEARAGGHPTRPEVVRPEVIDAPAAIDLVTMQAEHEPDDDSVVYLAPPAPALPEPVRSKWSAYTLDRPRSHASSA